MTGDAQAIKAAIRAEALAQGFDAVGFAPAALAPEARAGLAAFLAKGHLGDMGWFAARTDERGSPDALWPEVQAVVVPGLSYAPGGDPLAGLAARDRFVRNVLVASGNSGMPASCPRLDDASPLVRAMAVWAVRRLADDADFATLAAARGAVEEAAAVRAE